MKVHYTVLCSMILLLQSLICMSVRGNVETDKPNTITLIIVNPVPGTIYTEGGSFAFSASLSSTNPSELAQVAKVSFFNGNGLLFEDTDLSDGASFIYENIPAGTFTLRAQAFNASGSSLLAEDEVEITIRALPRASINLPSQGGQYVEGDPVSVRVEATDQDGTIERVELYIPVPRELIATLTTPTPQNIFEYEWSGLAPGVYKMYAQAFDDDGASVITDTVEFQVLDRPRVVLTSPKATDEFSEGDTIRMAAFIEDLEDAIDTLRFYANGLLLEERTNSTDPVYNWENVPFGIYDLTAEVVDNSNLSSTSIPVTIRIKAKPIPIFEAPFTTMDTVTAPEYIEGDTIEFIVGVTDPDDGFITRVEFWVSDTLLFTDTTGDFRTDRLIYRHKWASNRSGILPFYAYAFDNDSLFRVTQLFLVKIQAKPKVRFLIPKQNEQFGLGNDIDISVSAVDRDNEIDSVKFYIKDPNGIRDSLIWFDILEDDGWTATWKSPPLGNHVIYAVAIDETGIAQQSSDRNVTVFPRSNVSYFSFKTKQIPTGVKLDWQTSQLFRIDEFEVERSLDGVTYTPIEESIIKAEDNTTTQLLSYSYTDPWVGIDSSEKLYYRIRGKGMDRQDTYSRVDSILRGEEFTVDVFPIPISQQGAARIIIGGEADVLEFWDLSGRPVYRQLIPEDEKRIFFAGKTLEPGFYIMVIKSILGEGENQKEFMVTKKILIHGDF